MKPLALRDHAREILQAVSKDISTPQSREAQTAKSLGLAPILSGAPETAAQTHGFLRAQSGFDINQLACQTGTRLQNFTPIAKCARIP
jgi:hypothetical protein